MSALYIDASQSTFHGCQGGLFDLKTNRALRFERSTLQWVARVHEINVGPEAKCSFVPVIQFTRYERNKASGSQPS